MRPSDPRLRRLLAPARRPLAVVLGTGVLGALLVIAQAFVVTGLVVAAKGPGFATAGFRPGDIVTQVNGQSVGDLQSLQNQIAPGARLSLTVERGAAVASVNLIVQGQ